MVVVTVPNRVTHITADLVARTVAVDMRPSPQEEGWKRVQHQRLLPAAAADKIRQIAQSISARETSANKCRTGHPARDVPAKLYITENGVTRAAGRQ
jgi:hypothetical protein